MAQPDAPPTEEPQQPDSDRLSSEELEHVAGGEGSGGPVPNPPPQFDPQMTDMG